MLPSEFDNWLNDPRRRPLVMGVLNVTPDSFSDDGQFDTPQSAADAALRMLDAGADLIDVGGESTRPGSLPVSPDEQIRRIQPAIAAIRRRTTALLSIDTTRWSVAAAALAEGANLINDTSAGQDDPAMLPGARNKGGADSTPIILMHRPAAPAQMQANPTYADVTAQVAEFLRSRLAAAIAAGLGQRRILLDPGIGFGKTVNHNLTLLRDLPALAAIGPPLVIGASRKSFIGRVLNQPDPTARIYGDAAVICWAITNGTAMLRVHDVEAMAQVARMTAAIRRGAMD